MRLTHQAASTRSKKGWETKHKKHPAEEESNERHHRLAMLGIAAAIPTTQRIARNKIRETRHQYVWQRPGTGEKIIVKGFKPDEIVAVKMAAGAVDSHLKHGVRVNTPLIRARTPSIPVSMLGHALRMSGRDETLQEFDRKIPKGNPNLAGRNFARKVLHLRSKDARITVNRTGEYFGYPRETAGLVTHELAHGVDAGHIVKNSTEFGKAFDWAFQSSRQGKDFVRKSSHPGIGYAAAAADEDFAETFRVMTGKSINGFETDVPARTIRGLDSESQFFQPIVDNKRRAYMHKHFIREQPLKEKVTPTWFYEKPGLHRHTNKFVAGAAIAGIGVGYGTYKYKHDPRFKRNVNRRVRQVKRYAHI